jgi:uncharacterized SAM-binding protein YcdF (DUF218 family)
VKASLKLLAGVLVAPLALAFLLAGVALLFRLFGRRRTATALFASGIALAWVCSLPVIGDIFLLPLESRYASLDEAAPELAQVSAIVILGSGYYPRENRPITAALDAEGLARIAEGVRLAMRFPAAKLVVSGGSRDPDTAPARGYARFAREFGIPAERVIVLDTARDTAQEAAAIAALFGSENFIVVTSAQHMLRAVTLMERAGLSPIPAPTSNHTGSTLAIGSWRDVVLPSATGARKTEMAWHEYMGLAAIHLGLD